MGVLDKLFYHTWNIGIVERSIYDIIVSTDSQLGVNWVKHNYRDRFFADPFILDLSDTQIQVLVEEFPYSKKKGVISLLTIDRRNYKLLRRKVVLEQPFHMSYPYIHRDLENNVAWVAPEASMSGCLYKYSWNSDAEMLMSQELLIEEPLLDSTIVEHDNRFWLFCTKRGPDSNSKLYLYYSDNQCGPWKEHPLNPVMNDSQMARPAGYMVKVDGYIYRVVQKNDKTYGERIYLTKIEELSTTAFKEVFVKELCAQKDKYSHGFHTINGYKDICVVDGLCKVFSPLRRIFFELRYKLGI